MPLSNTKIVQSYIQGLVEVVKKLQEVNIKATNLKSKFDTKNPDLTGTNITSAQINAVNTFLTNIDSLATGTTATAILNKDQPSHGTQALD